MNGLLQLKMFLVKHVLLRSLASDAAAPDKAQARVLQHILEGNKDTTFGKQYDFSSLRSVGDFKERIPVHGYEELRPYIERQIETGEYAVVPEKPLMYAQTSGTTGKPKYIPILRQTVTSYKRAQRISSYAQHRDVPGIFDGKILAIVSPSIEGHLRDGTPFGSMSGMVYQHMPAIILSKYVLPPVLFEVADYDSKYLLIAAFALREESISCLATANPSTFLKISDIIHQHSEALVRFVASGNLDDLDVRLEDKEKQRLQLRCTPRPERAQALDALMKQRDRLHFHDIWPRIRAAIVWTSGNCTLLLPKLRKQLPPDSRIIEMGYLSSEFRGTITIDCARNLGLPTLQDNFFEFADVALWDSGNRATLLLSQLEQGKRYYILVTTPHGLYRYFINDIIEVTGRYQNTPTIAFVQKGKGVTNLTGEKLYEAQVIEAVQYAAGAQQIESEFFMMLADQQDFSYTLYIESREAFDMARFTTLLGERLGQLNIEYHSKAQSGRIKPVVVKQLRPGAVEAYKTACIRSGQREGQFKVVKLQYRADVPFSFEEYVA